ncbi:DrmB family protein [Actinomadura sp. 9N407]|uniref:DrmB family protein n=1 Tax=Actinomadura sp. 9N407 TaxID=3375154 RepID=UPI003791E8BD
MTENALFRRRVGSVRPSHLMFTSGVGALVDLPNFSVLVKGLDDWSHQSLPEAMPINEPRLLKAVQWSLRTESVRSLMPAPWMEGLDKDPNGPAARVGVPVAPFPNWFRCTACNDLGALDSGVFGFENGKARKPHEARFFHEKCKRKKPLAVAARFVLSCTNGHLDEFPYSHFVHRGGDCPVATHPRLRMDDRGGNLGANVEIKCVNCEERRNIRDAQGKRGEENLPRCRGRHPHLGIFDKGCDRAPKMLTIGASNQWFAQGLAALAVPQSGASALGAKVEQHWDNIEDVPRAMYHWARENAPVFKELDRWTDDEVAEAIEAHRARLAGAGDRDENTKGPVDLRTPEWEVFSAAKLPDPSDDFTLRRDLDGVPGPLKDIYADVIQAERLREVRALIGFTRLDAPDPEDAELVQMVPLARSSPSWVPASEVRGEGIFLKLPEDLLQEWEGRIAGSGALRAHREAYGRYRGNRYSERIASMADFDVMAHWPGARFIALHTLSHLLIRTISLECGYSSASLSERIYSGTENDPNRSGILIYTAVPDAEGTLGGLVSLAEPERLVQLTRRALADARHCSSDPLCAERLPHAPADFLHGAACHVCLFVSETTCERGNKFLDRRFVVPIDGSDLALYPELP